MTPEQGLLFRSMEPPREIGRGRTLRYALVTSEANPTGATKHWVGGELMPPAAALAVVQYPSEDGYYLLYLDAAGNEVTDTWHATLDDALLQAEHEYFGIGDAWVEVGMKEGESV